MSLMLLLSRPTGKLSWPTCQDKIICWLLGSRNISFQVLLSWILLSGKIEKIRINMLIYFSHIILGISTFFMFIKSLSHLFYAHLFYFIKFLSKFKKIQSCQSHVQDWEMILFHLRAHLQSSTSAQLLNRFYPIGWNTFLSQSQRVYHGHNETMTNQFKLRFVSLNKSSIYITQVYIF